MSDSDRRRLLELFREPLAENDVITTPDALSDVVGELPAGAPAYQGAATRSVTSESGSRQWGMQMLAIGLVCIIVSLVVVIACLLRRPSDPPRVQGHEKDDYEDDEEVMQITSHIPVVTGPGPGAGGEQRPPRVQGGLPHMSQMRPDSVHARGPSHSKNTDPKASTGAPRDEDDEDDEDDPMFQPLDED